MGRRIVHKSSRYRNTGSGLRLVQRYVPAEYRTTLIPAVFTGGVDNLAGNRLFGNHNAVGRLLLKLSKPAGTRPVLVESLDQDRSPDRAVITANIDTILVDAVELVAPMVMLLVLFWIVLTAWNAIDVFKLM